MHGDLFFIHPFCDRHFWKQLDTDGSGKACPQEPCDKTQHLELMKSMAVLRMLFHFCLLNREYGEVFE